MSPGGSEMPNKRLHIMVVSTLLGFRLACSLIWCYLVTRMGFTYLAYRGVGLSGAFTPFLTPL